MTSAQPAFEAVHEAIEAIRAGRAVVLLDDDSPDSAGELVFAAEHACAELVSFAVRYGSGFLCVSVPDSVADRLGLVPMPGQRQAPVGTADFTVTVDASDGVSTGISAADRARTIALLAAADTRPEQLSRPGHVLPIRAHRDGLLGRVGHTEGSSDLVRLAGLSPVAALTELVSRVNPLRMATGTELGGFAEEFGLPMVSIVTLLRYRAELTPAVRRVVRARIPHAQGNFAAIGYTADRDGREHVAFIRGEPALAEDLPVRVHRECLLGDVFGSRRCGCAEDLRRSLELIAQAGAGIVIYLRSTEGTRDGGLLAKLRSYQDEDCQDRDRQDRDRQDRHCQDRDCERLRPAAELLSGAAESDAAIAASILRDLKVGSVRLIIGDRSSELLLRSNGIRVTGSRQLSSGDRPDRPAATARTAS